MAPLSPTPSPAEYDQPYGGAAQRITKRERGEVALALRESAAELR